MSRVFVCCSFSDFMILISHDLELQEQARHQNHKDIVDALQKCYLLVSQATSHVCDTAFLSFALFAGGLIPCYSPGPFQGTEHLSGKYLSGLHTAPGGADFGTMLLRVNEGFQGFA